jgi:TetR/AcrR family acrAB operon transcriptional repressor
VKPAEGTLSTREKILEGAKQAFAAQGFPASMKDIAKASGISTTSLIFWHFKDKENLFTEVMKGVNPLAQVEHVLQSRPAEQLAEVTVENLVKEYFSVYKSPLNRQLLFQMISAIPTHPALQSVLQNQITDLLSRQVAEVIAQGQSENIFRHDLPPDFLAQLILGLLFALIARWYVEEELPWQSTDVAAKLLTVLKIPA